MNGQVGSAYGIAVLRVVTGIVFAAHGAQKAFEFGHSGTAAIFDGMGIPLAAVAAVLVIASELLGGIALAIGLATRYVAVPLAIIMITAMMVVHLPNGFFIGNGGIEFVLVLLGSTIVSMTAGPGAFAVDNVLASRKLAAIGAAPEPTRR